MRSGLFTIVGLLAVATLLAMFIAGVWLLARSRRGGPSYPSCGSCSYDMTGSIGKVDRCPECGVDVAVAGITPPQGGRSMPKMVVGLVLLVTSVTCVSGFLLSAVRAGARPQPVIAPAPPPPMPAQQPAAAPTEPEA